MTPTTINMMLSLNDVMLLVLTVLFYTVLGIAILGVFRDAVGPVTFRLKWQARLARFTVIAMWPFVGVWLFYKANISNESKYL